MDNKKVIVKNTKKYGNALFAKEDIEKDEIIASFEGQIYQAEKASDLPNNPPLYIQDHVIQFDKNKWIDSSGFARIISHSCEPNCGIKNKTTLISIRKIKKGEKLSYDYDMTENSDWSMKCSCGEPSCRKIIKGFRYLTKEKLSEYNGYISEWLKK